MLHLCDSSRALHRRRRLCHRRHRRRTWCVIIHSRASQTRRAAPASSVARAVPVTLLRPLCLQSPFEGVSYPPICGLASDEGIRRLIHPNGRPDFSTQRAHARRPQEHDIAGLLSPCVIGVRHAHAAPSGHSFLLPHLLRLKTTVATPRSTFTNTSPPVSVCR